VLTGKTALITGGSSGIGLATAKRLQTEGARVAITGTDAAKLETALAEVGGNTIAIQADVRRLPEIKAMATRVAEAFDTLDILFANAGVAYRTPIATTIEEAFGQLMDVNVKGVFFTVQSVLPIFNDGGAMILNTSWLSQVGAPGRAALSASKATVRSLTRVLAAELADRRIRVNAVSPGPIETPIHRTPTRRKPSSESMRMTSVPRCRPAGWAGPRRSRLPWLSSREMTQAICSARKSTSMTD
jgi:NAD(P)-dependent dehydrogenase (short-subunit alcohol dehydrogenase family)